MDRVVRESKLSRVQVDIIDPLFADNLTIYPVDLIEVNLNGLTVDVHLMTNDPIDEVVECSHVPGIGTVIAQIERMESQNDFIHRVGEFGLKAGFSLDLHTPVDSIEENCFEKLAVVQVMGNKAGEQGEEFAGEKVLAKIRELKKIKDEQKLPFAIAVDIGINPETAKLCREAGADELVTGSYLWDSANLSTAIAALS